MKTRVLMMAAAALFLAGCEGERGPAGPVGPEGPAGRDGTGLVASYEHREFFDGDPVPDNATTVSFKLAVQADEIISFTGYASVVAGGREGLVELPFLVSHVGEALPDQGSILMQYDPITDEFLIHYVQLRNFHAYVRVDIFKAPAAGSAAPLQARIVSGR